MSLIEVLILAVVQGITEFLPISSDGHLVVANELLRSAGYPAAPDMLEVTIALHMGTLLSMILWYWREIVQMLTVHRRVIPLIVLASIPAGVAGVYLKKVLDEGTTSALLESVPLAGWMFLVTGLMLVVASRAKGGDTEYPKLGWGAALGIGLAQAFAILPGASRSGSTIAAALLLGMRRDQAATFSFLMGMPVIAGAGLLEGLDILQEGVKTPASTLLVGIAVSAAVGVGAIASLVRIVKRGKLSLFAWYLGPLGIAVIAWCALGRAG